MPKMKTRRAAAKRFKKTGTGKIKRTSNYRGHFLSKKTSTRKRRLRKDSLVSKSDEKRISKLLPY